MDAIIVERIILVIIGFWFILQPTMRYLASLAIRDKVTSRTVAYLIVAFCTALVAYGVTLLF